MPVEDTSQKSLINGKHHMIQISQRLTLIEIKHLTISSFLKIYLVIWKKELYLENFVGMEVKYMIINELIN